MRQKPGLHKKISSIFDGIPVPKTDQGQVPETEHEQSADSAHSSGPAQTQKNTGSGYQKPAPPNSKMPSPSPGNRPATLTKTPPKPDQSSKLAPKPAPAKPKFQPIPKRKTNLPTLQSQFLSKVKDFLVSLQDGSEQARQRKMAILVGLLSIVMACILFSVLNKPEKGSDKPGSDTAASLDLNQTQTWKINWTAPELYPGTLRDPMRYNLVTNADPTINQIGQLVVKGIVFSEEKPSAIISDRIVAEGEQILGVTVVKINKESVVFEKDDKTWTQPVQR
jgi:hypothetical protein